MTTSAHSTPSHATTAKKVRGAGKNWTMVRDFRGYEFGKLFVMKYLGMKAEGGKSSKGIRVYSCHGLRPQSPRACKRAPSPSPSATDTCTLLVKVCQVDGCVYTDSFCTCSENNKGRILPFPCGTEVADVAALNLEYPLGYMDRCHEPLPIAVQASPGRKPKTPKSLKRPKAAVAVKAKTAAAATTTTNKKGRKCIDPARPRSPVLGSAFDGPSIFFRSHRVLPKTPLSATVATAAAANVPMPMPLFHDSGEEEVERPTPYRGGSTIFAHDVEHRSRFLYNNAYDGDNGGSTGMNSHIFPIETTPRAYFQDETSRQSAASAATTADCSTPDDDDRISNEDEKDFYESPLSEGCAFPTLTASDFDDMPYDEKANYGESRPGSSLGFNAMSLSSSFRGSRPGDDSDMDSMSLSSSDMVFSDKDDDRDSEHNAGNGCDAFDECMKHITAPGTCPQRYQAE